MSAVFTPDPASAAQIGAADPRVNVWLVANAGSGKTKVLTDRVARLLLGGVDPQNILCLTYTKAAAAEMQNRLFRRLGEWAMAGDAALRANLAKLGEEGALPEDRLRLARQLFARAIETPGGIRIQTIHSFCAGLLRRFPLEAGVSPGFTELDDRSAALLRAEILEDLAAGPEAALFEAILPEVQERADMLLQQIVGKRADLLSPPDEAALRAAFELPPGMDEATLLEQSFAPGDPPALVALIAGLKASEKSTDQKAAAALAALHEPWGMAALQVMEGVFLTGAGAKEPFSAKIGSFPTRDTRNGLGEVMTQIEGLMARVEAARPMRLALAACRKALALHRFAHAFLRRYEAAKTRQGWLDFDDFITRATRLLTDPSVAPWVLYRLDGSIDHVLVDEAQDTSPAQWKIIAALTEEFTAGEGARGTPRSLFVVGDRKQSIYSFQGADVAGFDAVRQGFADRFAAAGSPVTERAMVHSFRSSWAILSLVDHAFPGEMQAALGGEFRHQPFFDAMPGRVDIWPPVPKPEKPEPREWYDPVDLQGATDAPVVLAGQIADEIASMIARGAQIPDRGSFRPVHAGDFLILVQRRGPIFEAVIRACKARGLPIAGPDRLTLSEELAVRDILAVLKFLDTPEDDLSLATALRSPLFGWSEARLYALAHHRRRRMEGPDGSVQGSDARLWEALRQDPGAGETLEILHDLRNRAEFLRPYELIDRILTRHHGREKLLGRMGEEAADAIDELVSQALAHERGEVPGLTAFLVWMAAGEVEVKRQAEGAGRLIRVMTVHGSKGLEAPVVILPDTGDRRLSDKDMLLRLDEGVVTWAGRKDEDAGRAAAVKEARTAARAAENLRLLYVAMTRARSWLIVAAAGEAGEGSWHRIITKGAEQLALSEIGEGRLRHQFGDWLADAPAPELERVEVAAPEAALTAADAPPALPLISSPSRLGGEHLVAGTAALSREDLVPALPSDMADALEEPADPLARGSQLHLLLELLPAAPQDAWSALAERLGAGAMLPRAARILADPDFAWIFGPDSMAEVAVSAPWAEGVIEGAIDRLVVTPEAVTIVDFKSNSVIPAGAEGVPEAYLRQLGAYAHAVAAIWPDRPIRCAILWTEGPRLTRIPLEAVSAALARTGQP